MGSAVMIDLFMRIFRELLVVSVASHPCHRLEKELPVDPAPAP